MIEVGIGVMFILFGVGAARLMFGPVGHAVSERLRRGAPEDPALAEELERMRSRLTEVEQRLDFAERLLTQGAVADHLPGGPDR